MTGIVLDAPRDLAPSFAEPGEALGAADTMKALFRAPIDPLVNPKPYADLIRASERVTRLTGNAASISAAREEAYDARIRAIEAATGIKLENPEAGGYFRDALARVNDQVRRGERSPSHPAADAAVEARNIFDEKLDALAQSNPDKMDALTFGRSVDDEAMELAKGSVEQFQTARKAAGLNPFVAPIDVFAGGLWGSGRDPIFMGSLLAGPASSTSKYALGRIASGALRAGFYSAGISALEQPTVQAWREKLGLEHGLMPAVEDVGQAFLFGMIPGAVIHGGIEAVRAVRIRRLLAGLPEPGDADAATDALLRAAGSLSERDRATLLAGEESALADKATMTVPRPKDVPEPLHDDMGAAALKRADQPDAPSPEAVRIVRQMAQHDLFELPQEARSATVEQTSNTEFVVRSAESAGDRVYLRVEPKAIRIDFSEVAPENRGQGVGTALYEKALEFAAERGLPLRSDFRLSPDAVRIYEALRRRGYEVTETPGTHTFESGQKVNLGERYVFEVRPRRPPEVGPPEVRDRVLESAPKTEAEAARLADEALDDLGRTHGMANVRDSMAAADAARSPAAVDRYNKAIETYNQAVKDYPATDPRRRAAAQEVADARAAMNHPEPAAEAAPKRARGDVLDKVPWVDEQGRPTVISRTATIGERDANLSMLVKSCK